MTRRLGAFGCFAFVCITMAAMSLSYSQRIFRCFSSLLDAFGGLASTAGPVGGGDSFIQFRMILPMNGGWTLHFDPTVDQNRNPAFIFTEGDFTVSAPLPTPDPASLVLLGTGLAGIAWRKYKAVRH